jgi:apolipoprotein D and lipocalin family protein
MLPAPVIAALLAATATLFAASSAFAQAPVTTVDRVDLDRYAGRWYEIARLPNKFQAECVRDVVATYTRRGPNSINVINECRHDDGMSAHVEGIARVRDLNTNAKLEVRFAPLSLAWLPFVWDDYWIMDLAPDYSYALVGEPSHTYLWVLARAPKLDSPVYERLLAKAAAQGYDTSKVQRTQQTLPAP